jgi:hypothetical protein
MQNSCQKFGLSPISLKTSIMINYLSAGLSRATRMANSFV